MRALSQWVEIVVYIMLHNMLKKHYNIMYYNSSLKDRGEINDIGKKAALIRVSSKTGQRTRLLQHYYHKVVSVLHKEYPTVLFEDILFLLFAIKIPIITKMFKCMLRQRPYGSTKVI